MKTTQIADVIIDKYPGDLGDFSLVTNEGSISNGCYIEYDPCEKLERFNEDDPSEIEQLRAHNDIRAWLRAIGYTDDMEEILINVWW